MAEEQGSRPTGQPPAPVRGETKAMSLSAQQLEALKDMKSSLSSIASSNKALIEGFKSLSSYLKASNDRLAAKATEDKREKKKDPEKPKQDDLKMPGMGDWGKILTLALIAVATEIDNIVRAFKLAVSIPDITKMLTSFMGSFSFIGKATSLLRSGADSILKSVADLFKPVTNAFGSIAKALSKIPLLDDFAKVFTSIGNFLSKGIGSFKSAGSILEKMIDVLGFLPGLRPILGSLKVLFGPFGMVLFGLFDFISGFIKGFKEGGILEGLKEGGLEVIRGMVTAPLDLLKDIVSWIASKLGFENFSAALDSFSFTDLFNEYVVPAVDGIFNWIGKIFTNPTEAMGDFSVFTAKLVAIPYDLIKNMVSWIASKLGFESFSETLNSFSFSGLVDEYIAPAIRSIYDWIGSLFTNPVETISKLATGIDNFALMIGTMINDNIIKPLVDWLKDLIPSWDDIKKMISDNLPSITPNWVKESMGLTTEQQSSGRTAAPTPEQIAAAVESRKLYDETLAKMAKEAQSRSGSSFQTAPVVINNTTNQMGGGQSQTLGNIGVSTAAGPSGYKAREHW